MKRILLVRNLLLILFLCLAAAAVCVGVQLFCGQENQEDNIQLNEILDAVSQMEGAEKAEELLERLGMLAQEYAMSTESNEDMEQGTVAFAQQQLKEIQQQAARWLDTLVERGQFLENWKVIMELGERTDLDGLPRVFLEALDDVFSEAPVTDMERLGEGLRE